MARSSPEPPGDLAMAKFGWPVATFHKSSGYFGENPPKEPELGVATATLAEPRIDEIPSKFA